MACTCAASRPAPEIAVFEFTACSSAGAAAEAAPAFESAETLGPGTFGMEGRGAGGGAAVAAGTGIEALRLLGAGAGGAVAGFAGTVAMAVPESAFNFGVGVRT